jgi:putative inorganic carbon (HCO3(-)) transporter
LTLPGRFVSLEWHPYLVIALFLFWPLRWLAAPGSPRSVPITSYSGLHPATVSMRVLLLCIAVSLWVAADRAISWVAAGYLLFGMATYHTLVHWPPARRTYWVGAAALLGCSIGLALVAPPFVEWKPDFRLFYLPLYHQLTSLRFDLGETIHANVLAGTLVLTAPILLALTLAQWPFARDQLSMRPELFPGQPVLSALLTMLALLWTVGLLVLTQSRGAYLALAVALPLVVLMRWPRLFALMPLGVFVVVWVVNQYGVLFLLEQFSAEGSLGGWDGRLAVWTQAVVAIRDFAFTGVGIGAFSVVLPLLYPLQVTVEDYPHAHNLFLQVGVDLGLPGLTAYLALLMNQLTMGVAVLHHTRRGSLPWALAAGALASLAALIVHGLVDAVTWGLKLAFMPWLLFALITLLYLNPLCRLSVTPQNSVEGSVVRRTGR